MADAKVESRGSLRENEPMDELLIFQAALGLTPPWHVVAVRFAEDKSQLDIELDFAPGSQFPCPECGKLCGVHDTDHHTWRHLDFFQHKTYLRARTPRVKCDEHGVRTACVPWARAHSGFTLLLEALIVTYARNGVTTAAIGRMVGEHDTRIWRVLEHYVQAARARLDTSAVTRLGVDETSRAKGHKYISVFVDMQESRIIYATEGKDHETVARFREDFELHGGCAANVAEVSMDMSKAFIKGVQEQFSDAKLTFDRFHVMQLANDAVDDVRREEQKHRPELKGSRLAWLKNYTNHTEVERELFEQLRGTTLKTARAWRLKDTLKALYDQPPELAEEHLQRWYF
jgi:transposase